MVYRVPTIDIIGEAVAAMQFPVVINSVVEVEPTIFLLDVCDVMHAQKGFVISVGGNDYTIQSVAAPNIIYAKGAQPITVASFEMYHPHFFHGTPISTGVELDKKKQAFDKIPMVWFLEQFTDTFNTDNNSPIERKIKGRLFFLSTGNPKDWQTEQAWRDGILPMARLQERFEKQLMEMNWLFQTEASQNEPAFEYDTEYYHQFGVYITNKGMPEQLWTDKLSGVEMNFQQLRIFRDGLCKDDCE